MYDECSILKARNKKLSCNKEESFCHTEDSGEDQKRKKAVEELKGKMKKAIEAAETDTAGIDTAKIDTAEIDTALWQTVIAYQNALFHTSSGLPFSYTVKHKKNGEYSGELVVSRKEGSKTLTRSSVMLAFHKVFEATKTMDMIAEDGSLQKTLLLPEYKGPKSIGQIFGISYVYSMFWKMGLIGVPEKVDEKLSGKKKAEEL